MEMENLHFPDGNLSFGQAGRSPGTWGVPCWAPHGTGSSHGFVALAKFQRWRWHCAAMLPPFLLWDTDPVQCWGSPSLP